MAQAISGRILKAPLIHVSLGMSSLVVKTFASSRVSKGPLNRT